MRRLLAFLLAIGFGLSITIRPQMAGIIFLLLVLGLVGWYLFRHRDRKP